MAAYTYWRFLVDHSPDILLVRGVGDLSFIVEDADPQDPFRRTDRLDRLLNKELLKGEHSVTGAFSYIVDEGMAVFNGILYKFFFLVAEEKIPEDRTPYNH